MKFLDLAAVFNTGDILRYISLTVSRLILSLFFLLVLFISLYGKMARVARGKR